MVEILQTSHMLITTAILFQAFIVGRGSMSYLLLAMDIEVCFVHDENIYLGCYSMDCLVCFI